MIKRLAALFCLIVIGIGLCACATPEAEAEVDYNNVVISGLDSVIVDRDTDTLDLLKGVTAEYTFEDGSVRDVTDKIRVVLPAGCTVEGKQRNVQ